MDRHFSQKRSKFNLSFDFFAKLTWLRSRNDSYSQFPRCPQGTPGTMTCLLCPKYDQKARGGGYFQKNWVGVCNTLLETLPLFQTKIWDFPYPISVLKPWRTLEPVACPERVTSCYGTYTVVGVNIKKEIVLSPNDEEVGNCSKKHTQFKTRVHKPYPISDQNGRNWYPISDQNG